MGFDESLVHHMGTSQTEALRQIPDTTIVGFHGYPGLCRRAILIIDGVLVAHQRLAKAIGISTGEMAFPTLLVVEFEGAVQLQVFMRITKTAIAVGIPQQTVVLIRDDKRNGYLRVILKEILVTAFHVKFL